ncbi:DUF6049 family protein [Streptomyces albus]|uniref:Uncharacterized protein n=1 Tax=Streptomyces albus TaxID=1888 RepID=A0A8H1LCQ8_9ACTN|nr:DUF6049 family protein [Streptomyces albus]TGG81476.1 hypothetical protein D8771_18815 [Streptomyces albus]UVN55877.1 DUF6049 family protein [Streptomyces albus]
MDERVAEAAERQAPPGRRGTNRWRRRATALLLAALPALGSTLPAAAPATAAPASPTAAQSTTAQSAAHRATTQAAAGRTAATTAAAALQGTGSRSARVSVNEVTPAVPAAGDTLTLSGTVTNTSGSTLSHLEIAPRIGPTLGSRSAIEQAGRRQGYLSGADGTEVSGGHRVKLSGLAPGITRSFALKIPVSDLHLGADGVYQLGVSLTGQTRTRPYPQVLGIGRTFVPWHKKNTASRTRITYLWPLISKPHVTARTQSDEQQTPVFRDESLAKELAPGGRLQEMLELGKDLDVTWVIDPDLLASVDMMAGRYRVLKPGGTPDDTVAGKGQEYAQHWLDELQRAVRGKDVVTLPFADPDLASLAHRGTTVRGALGSLSHATTLARNTVETVLHVKANTDFAWPYEGAVDTSVVDVATSAGAHNVIARSDSVRDPGLSYSPTAARPIGSGTTALVADARLSTAFEGDLSRAGASSLAVQQFLAQSLALADQAPSRTRSIVVAPQRMPSVSQAQAMAAGVKALSDSSWAGTADLTDAAEATPDPRAQRRMPAPSSYPASLRRSELPTAAFEQVRKTKEGLDDFKAILDTPERVMPPFSTAIDREVSNAWRDHSGSARDYRDSVEEYLLELRGAVKLIKKSDITLSGREATIPVTVQNNLAQGVDGLVLELRSSRVGLDVGDRKRVKVDGEHTQSLKFDTTAKNNGRAYVYAQLYTEDGEPYGKVMRFQVNVTSITSTVLLVIAGGVLLIVLAGIRMYTQRKRSGPAPDPDAPLEEPDGEDDGDGKDGDAPAEEPDEDRQEKADGTATAGSGEGDDTVRENDNPPATGEKVDR